MGEESSFKGYCHRAHAVDGDQHVYDAWFVMVDSGVFFRAGTTDAVAYIIQFGLECEDAALRDQLGAALVEAHLLPAGDGSYQRFARVLAEQTR